MKTGSPCIVVRLLVVFGLIAGMVCQTQFSVVAAEVTASSSASAEDEVSVTGFQENPGGPASVNAERLREFETLMDRYYRDDPLETAREKIKEEVRQYNQWAESAHARNKAAIAALNKQVESLRALDELTDEMDEKLKDKPDLSDKAAVDTYNALVEERNERVREYNELAKLHKKDKQAYQAADEQSDREAETRKADLEVLKENFERQIESHKQWFKTGEDLEMFKDLNRFFAQLHDQRRSGETPELADLIREVRTVRRELFEHTVATNERSDTGAVIVEARLCRQEPCFFLVDTGAMSVTISMALVEALGLTDRLGDEITATVAGGGRVRGRELTISQVAVQGREVEDVRAIVLDEFDAGVDGLLGMSYLKQFAIRIDPQHPDKLVIEPRPKD